jgi:hypothetical protein
VIHQDTCAPAPDGGCTCAEPEQPAPPPVPVGPYRLEAKRIRRALAKAEPMLREAMQLEGRMRQLRMDAAHLVRDAIFAATDSPELMLLGEVWAGAIRP